MALGPGMPLSFTVRPPESVRMKAVRLAPWFWPLVESFGGQEVVARQALAALPRVRLVAFNRQFRDASDVVNPGYREDMMEQLPDGCSEDYWQDFAEWVVSRGREFYHTVRTSPAEVAEYMAEFGRARGDVLCPRGVAVMVFYERFGKSLHEATYDDRGWPRRRGRRSKVEQSAAADSPRD